MQLSPRPSACMSDFEFEFDDDVGGSGASSSEFESEEGTEFLKLVDVAEMLRQFSRRLSDLTAQPLGVSMLMLNEMDWDVGVSMRAFVDGDKVVSKTFACVEGSPNVPPSATCPICLEVCKPKEFKSLSCGHAVCAQCFKTHTDLRLLGEQNLFSTRCPGSADCNLLVPREMLSSQQQQQFDLRVARKYILARPQQFRHCPHPNCDYVVRTNGVSGVPNAVLCLCSNVFCVGCGLPEDHSTLRCERAKEWRQLVENDNLHDLYVKHNARPCPQCGADTARDGGCNHLRCTACGFEYCWACRGAWAGHELRPFECTRAVEGPQAPKSTRTERRRHEQLVFYTHHFARHQFLAAAGDLYERRAHQTLAWAFAALYFLSRGPERDLLERVVKQLSEQPSLRQDAIDSVRRLLADII